jgi:hypothetical protein
MLGVLAGPIGWFRGLPVPRTAPAPGLTREQIAEWEVLADLERRENLLCSRRELPSPFQADGGPAARPDVRFWRDDGCSTRVKPL